MTLLLKFVTVNILVKSTFTTLQIYSHIFIREKKIHSWMLEVCATQQYDGLHFELHHMVVDYF